MSLIVLDANVVARYVLADHRKLSPEAKEIVEDNELYLDEVILAEVIWVLQSVYRKDRGWITSILGDFVSLSKVINPRKSLMLTALELFSGKKDLSYIDCWIYAVSQDLDLPLRTFDKKLARIAGNV